MPLPPSPKIWKIGYATETRLRIVMRGVVIVLGAVLVGWWPGLAVAEDEAGVEGFGDASGVHAHGIEQVAQHGIDSGCGDGFFCSSDLISRAEMAAWLYRAVALLTTPPSPTPSAAGRQGTGHSDAPDGAWYVPYARWAAANGVIDADSGAFNPDEAVTRAQAAEMLTAAFDHLAAVDRIRGVFADTADISQAAARAIEGIHAAGLTRGCAVQPLRYCPHQPITRAQSATMLARAIQRAEPTVGLIINEPQAARGYTIINTFRSDKVHLIDHLGREVHAWKLEGHEIEQAELLENGNLMIRHQAPSSDLWSTSEVDQAGYIIWQYTERNLHHDFLKLPNGNVLLLTRTRLTPQAAVAAGAVDRYQPSGWVYDYLLEIKPTGPDGGEVVWEWSTLDHLVQDHAPDKADYGPVAGHPGRIDINYNIRLGHRDLFHLNSIDYDPVLDQIMLSSRHYSELWIIDHNTTTEEAAGTKGDLLYRWGNPQAHGAGGYQDQQLFMQHDAHWIPSGLPGAGNVLIFNNGGESHWQGRDYSSIDEIALPPFETTDTSENPAMPFGAPHYRWTYTTPNPADFYSFWGAGVQRLPNGNTQICDTHNGTIFQVAPDGTTVWKYINPLPKHNPPSHQGDAPDPSNYTYRAPWYPPDHPGLKNMDLTPKGPIEHYR